MAEYWRMQLHPAQPGQSSRHCSESLAAGFVGLDFAEDSGDLRRAKASELPTGQRDYMDFATRMKIGDKILIIAHHFPYAMVTVAGDYNYIARREIELGIWFRHFRRIKDVRYYADHKTNVRAWDQLRMVDAFSSLKPTSQSYQLMKEWERAT